MSKFSNYYNLLKGRNEEKELDAILNKIDYKLFNGGLIEQISSVNYDHVILTEKMIVDFVNDYTIKAQNKNG